MGDRTVGLREVADLLGISLSTVSRALAGKPMVNERTRQRVIATAQALGAQGRSMTPTVERASTIEALAVLQPGRGGRFDDTELSRGVLERVEDVASRHGWHVVTARLDDRDDLIRFLGAGISLKGIIATRVDDEAARAVISQAREAGIPVALVNRDDTESGVFSCSPDHVVAGRLAVQHLVELGHRRIGLVLNRMTIQSNQRRMTGILAELGERGIAIDRSLIRTDIRSTKAAVAASEDLVLSQRATALVVAQDRMAADIVTHLQLDGVPVPGRVSVLSFDGSESGKLSSPPLTSIYTPWSEMATAAVNGLLALVEDPLLQRGSLSWRPKLIMRASTGHLGPTERRRP